MERHTRMRSFESFAVLLAAFLSSAAALTSYRRLQTPSEFCQLSFFCQRGRHYRRDALFAEGSNGDGDRKTTCDDDTKRPLALPPIGSSSAHTLANSVESRSDGKGDQLIDGNEDFVGAIVSRKFQISYTCKVCGHRNTHQVSRLAYRKGVVIAQCKGCFSRHWLADHLGWSKYAGGFDWENGERDIEQYMRNRDFSARLAGITCDVEGDVVKRVTQQVFDLETMLHNEGIPKINKEGDISEKDEEESWS